MGEAFEDFSDENSGFWTSKHDLAPKIAKNALIQFFQTVAHKEKNHNFFSREFLHAEKSGAENGLLTLDKRFFLVISESPYVVKFACFWRNCPKQSAWPGPIWANFHDCKTLTKILLFFFVKPTLNFPK